MSDEDLTIHRGTGCLWTDLGFSNPAEKEVVARLCAIISDVIRERGWTPGDAARAIDMDAEMIRHAMYGRLSQVTAGDLFEVITRLGCDVGISVGPPQNERGAVMVWRTDDE
ncbi:MAG: helix-turn-helix domain-containing protein [Beijerinckiaceae bacterium]|nr:helix-turn-helix domain-containing protein [Beijerinckiaceae bacterium]